MKTKFFLLFLAVFVWTGFVCAISFMEAWLKFRAPGVSVPIGLGIGKLVFGALNWVEWFFVMLIAATLLSGKGLVTSACKFCYGLAILILFTQTFCLLPALDIRADAYISGHPLASSSLHWYFVILELIKTATLISFGWNLVVSQWQWKMKNGYENTDTATQPDT